MKLSDSSVRAVSLAVIHSSLASAVNPPSTVALSTLSKTNSSSTPSPAASNEPSVPLCGAGFTYCGYILRDHKNFHEKDILQAYCLAHKGNCLNGTTKSDPIQALYICLPPNASPIEAWASGTDAKVAKTSPGLLSNIKEKKGYGTKDIRFHNHIHPNKGNKGVPNHHGVHIPSQPPTSSSSTNPSPEPPQPPPQPAKSASSPSNPNPQATPSSGPTGSSNSGDENGSNGNGNDTDSTTCASSATRPGNKIELLCACSRQCLNPTSDHIGRCDLPCSS